MLYVNYISVNLEEGNKGTAKDTTPQPCRLEGKCSNRYNASLELSGLHFIIIALFKTKQKIFFSCSRLTMFQVSSISKAIPFYICIFFFRFFSIKGYYKILNFLCYTVGPYCLSILYTVVCILNPNSQFIHSIPSFLFGNHKFNSSLFFLANGIYLYLSTNIIYICTNTCTYIVSQP